MSINHMECEVRHVLRRKPTLTSSQPTCITALPAALIHQRFQLKSVRIIQQLCNSASIHLSEKLTKLEMACKLHAIALTDIESSTAKSCAAVRARLREKYGDLYDDVYSVPSPQTTIRVAWRVDPVSVPIMEASISELNRSDLRTYSTEMGVTMTRDETSNKRGYAHALFSAILAEHDRLNDLNEEELCTAFAVIAGCRPPEHLCRNDIILVHLLCTIPEELIVRLLACVPGEGPKVQEKAFKAARRRIEALEMSIR